MTKINNEWEKQFDKEFLNDPYEKGIVYASGVCIKDFISKTLQKQREEIIKECLKGAKDDITGLYDYDRIAKNVIDLIKK